MKIVIPGGAGHMGRVLARAFTAGGHDVVRLSRAPGALPWRTAAWDGVSDGAWREELDGADLVVNLAGCSVDCRYTANNRRVVPGRLLADGCRFEFPEWPAAARDLCARSGSTTPGTAT